MKVKKILNNNAIITRNKKNKEVIVMGKGLAYGLKRGDFIDESRIDKVFSLSNSREISRFSELIAQVPESRLELAEKFIDYAREKLGKKFKNTVYLTLTDHVNTMFERAEAGAYIKNTMLWDIKRLYPDEFKTAYDIILNLNEKMNFNFDENEAASIAMHFVNAQTNLDISTTTNITKFISEVLNVVKYNFRIEYDEDSLSYYRFIVHLRSFAHRLFSGKAYNDMVDSELLRHIERKYAESFFCANLIKKFVDEVYNFSLEGEEVMYLTIHIEKVVKDSVKV